MAVDLFAQVEVPQGAGFKALVDIPGENGRGSATGRTVFFGALREGIDLLRAAHSIEHKVRPCGGRQASAARAAQQQTRLLED